MQNLQADLIELLKNEDNLVVDNQLNKNKIIEAALKVEPFLISLLIKNDTFKKHFFTEVPARSAGGENVLVFDKIKFQRFVNNKSFLPDSYTAFKNKIGLAINDDTTDNFIKAKNDVVLVWPHKDCVLEGGQTKEDQKRNEIFWNETLAPDNVDRLLDAKAFTNFKKYDKEGEHKVTELNGNENLILKGNNLLVLGSLLKSHRGKIDLIYIDPPFNTSSDSFLYNDKFSSSTWLTFMKNRLEIAKELLKKEGTIYVHIDHNEGHYLKVLMDEIFGRDNFRNEIIWRYSGWNKKLRDSFERRHDSIFMYGKSDAQYFESYFEKWESKEVYVKKRKQKLLVDEDGREYVLSDAGGGKRAKTFIEDILNKGVVVDDVWYLDKLNNSAKESVGFSSQKKESLLERIISASCPKDGIVLDFHLGSGTTAATAHKLGRNYIGVEQMEYVDVVTIPRMLDVIAGNQEGISKDVNWQGGGSFVYAELMQFNQYFIDKIQAVKTKEDILAIWEEMQDKAFLSYQFDKDIFNQRLEAFKTASLETMQHYLIEVLDKNQLYVNFSEIEDTAFNVSAEDKALNHAFYKK